jgi:hypothetical protein
MSFSSSRWSVAVPFLLYLVHACLFGRWIIDDAAISFVYARNLAAGHGLVAQPGLPPVEGYSNFLWVLLMALFFLLRLFHPVLTPKLVGMALTGGLFLGLHDALRRLDPAGGAIAFVVLCATALNTSFTVWTVSGLENALYAALIGLLFWLLVRERTGEPRPWIRWLPTAAGAVAAGIALTRPDGMLYAGLYPLLTLGAEGRPLRFGAAAGRIARFAAVALVLYGGFLAFRYAYFGDLQPNTYYAKSAKMSALLRDLLELKPSLWDRLHEPVESAAGDAGQLLVSVLIAGAAFLAWRRRLRWAHLALLAFAGCAAVVYILLPGDWMREFRFTTPFHPFAYAVAVLLAVDLGRELVPRPGPRKVAGRLAAAAALGLALLLFVPRTLAYAADPALPFSQIEERIGRRYNRFAAMLDLPAGASYLGPDVGGALWASRLRIYDLGGLTDRTVARTLRGHRKEFHDYVFAVARPTFILMHSEWGFAARLNLDPRFRRDYVPLYVEGEPGERTINLGNPRQSGVFVRKDAIVGKEAAVEKIRAELAADY